MKNWIKNTQEWGVVFAPDSRNGGADQEYQVKDSPASDRFDALMSLALDDMLSSGEEVEFDRMLAAEPVLCDVWDEWQAFDFAFHSAPCIEPPAGFVASVEGRVVRRERRRRLWLGVGIGVIAVALWSSLVIGLAGAGAYVMFNQSDWLASVVRLAVQGTAAIQVQATMLVDAVLTALATPQMQGMAVAYALFSVLALWFWAKFLGRSVASQQLAAPRGA